VELENTQRGDAWRRLVAWRERNIAIHYSQVTVCGCVTRPLAPLPYNFNSPLPRLL
jgi:hypothetical protein